jgi:hypothetical protein
MKKINPDGYLPIDFLAISVSMDIPGVFYPGITH